MSHVQTEVLEFLSRVGSSLLNQALSNLRCQQDYHEKKLRKAAEAGSALILSAGSFEGAVELHRSQLQEKGNLLQAVCDGKIRGLTTLREAYLKEMALEGIPSRRSDAPTRTEAKNHGGDAEQGLGAVD